MALLTDRRRSPSAPADAGRARKRPVVLATLAVRVDPDAERMALDSALEAGVPLIVANMLAMRSYPMTLTFAPDCLNLPHEEDLYEVRATAVPRGRPGDRHRAPADHGPAARFARCSSC